MAEMFDAPEALEPAPKSEGAPRYLPSLDT
jgi:hypothetical protein